MSLFNYAFWTSWLFLRIVPSAWSALYVRWRVIIPAPLLTFFFLNFYQVVNPQASTPCQAGRKCLVEWLDDGRVPLLTSMGASTVGLYHDDQRLVQQITPVDVSAVHSLEFTVSLATSTSLREDDTDHLFFFFFNTPTEARCESRSELR
jgi:hypothetical protein